MGHDLLEILVYILAFLAGALAGEAVHIVTWDFLMEKKALMLPPECICGSTGSRIYIHPGILRLFVHKEVCPVCNRMRPLDVFATEVVLGLGFAYLIYRYGFRFELFAAFSLLCLLTFAFRAGVAKAFVPNSLILWFLGLGLIVSILNEILPISFLVDQTWWNQPVAALGTGVFLLLMSFLGSFISRKEMAIGPGDIKLFMVTAFCIGWRLAVFAVFIAVFLAGMAGAVLLIAGIREREDTLPFSPFIAVGAALSIFFWQELIFWFTGMA